MTIAGPLHRHSWREAEEFADDMDCGELDIAFQVSMAFDNFCVAGTPCSGPAKRIGAAAATGHPMWGAKPQWELATQLLPYRGTTGLLTLVRVELAPLQRPVVMGAARLCRPGPPGRVGCECLFVKQEALSSVMSQSLQQLHYQHSLRGHCGQPE